MVEPSNSNVWAKGAIELKPDYSNHILKLGIHFTTVHLGPGECLQLVYKLFFYGIKIWGVAWGNGVLIEQEKVNLDEPNISVPTGAQVKDMGEDI